MEQSSQQRRGKAQKRNCSQQPGMSEPGNPKNQPDLRPTTPPSGQPLKPAGETSNGYSSSGKKAHYPNPPETVNPDAATLRDQWKFAMRQYGKWYSHAWGTAILAGAAFFALGWIVKGGNPLPSLSTPKHDPDDKKHPSSSDH